MVERKFKWWIACSLLSIIAALYFFNEPSENSMRFLILGIIGFIDFLYQDLFPQWWHWGRWANNFSDEISEEMVEFIGYFMMGISATALLIMLLL